MLLDVHGLFVCNIVVGGLATWCHISGKAKRIDYICLDLRLKDAVVQCYVDMGVDLAPGAREDHYLLVLDIDAQKLGQAMAMVKTQVEERVDKKPGLCFDPVSLKDPASRASFKWHLGRHHVDKAGNIDEEVAKWQSHLLDSAKAAFRTKAAKQFKKDWLSQGTMDIMGFVSQTRAARRVAECAAAGAAMHVVSWHGRRTLEQLMDMSGDPILQSGGQAA